MQTIPNFSRYTFHFFGKDVKVLSVANAATGNIIELYSGAKTPSYRLTNDEGKRVVLSVEKIVEQLPSPIEIPTIPEPQTLVDSEAMQPLLYDEGNDLSKPYPSSERVPVVEEPGNTYVDVPTLITTTLPEVKILETVKEESKEAPKKKVAGKLSEDQVKEIRQRALNGEKQAALAVEFKINPSTVSEIKTGVLFKKITAGIVATVTEENKDQNNQPS